MNESTGEDVSSLLSLHSSGEKRKTQLTPGPIGHADQPPSQSDSLTPLQKTAYMAFQVLPGYLSARLRDRMLTASWSDQPLPRSWFSLVDVRRLSRRRRRRNEEEEDQWGREWKRVAWEVMGLGEKLGAMAGLANFLVFLYDGK